MIREAECMRKLELEVPENAKVLGYSQLKLKGHHTQLQVLCLSTDNLLYVRGAMQNISKYLRKQDRINYCLTITARGSTLDVYIMNFFIYPAEAPTCMLER